MARGAKPGERRGGRAKGTLNKSTADIKAVAREMTPQATKRLGDLLKSENESVALGAIKEVYDRAYGKSAQPVGGGDGTEAIKHLFGWLPSDG